MVAAELVDSREPETRTVEAVTESQVDGPDMVAAGKVGMEAPVASQRIGSVEVP